jgi:hypothetical protein
MIHSNSDRSKCPSDHHSSYHQSAIVAIGKIGDSASKCQRSPQRIHRRLRTNDNTLHPYPKHPEEKNPFFYNFKFVGVVNNVKNYNGKLTLRLYIDFIAKTLH